MDMELLPRYLKFGGYVYRWFKGSGLLEKLSEPSWGVYHVGAMELLKEVEGLKEGLFFHTGAGVFQYGEKGLEVVVGETPAVGGQVVQMEQLISKQTNGDLYVPNNVVRQLEFSDGQSGISALKTSTWAGVFSPNGFEVNIDGERSVKYDGPTLITYGDGFNMKMEMTPDALKRMVKIGGRPYQTFVSTKEGWVKVATEKLVSKFVHVGLEWKVLHLEGNLFVFASLTDRDNAKWEIALVEWEKEARPLWKTELKIFGTRNFRVFNTPLGILLTTNEDLYLLDKETGQIKGNKQVSFSYETPALVETTPDGGGLSIYTVDYQNNICHYLVKLNDNKRWLEEIHDDIPYEIQRRALSLFNASNPLSNLFNISPNGEFLYLSTNKNIKTIDLQNLDFHHDVFLFAKGNARLKVSPNLYNRIVSTSISLDETNWSEINLIGIC